LDYCALVQSLGRDLKLTSPAIGIAYVEHVPEGIPRYSEAVPSACTFWKAAQTSLFYATAEDHYNCPIGAITQGFTIPEEVGKRAMALIEQMDNLQYFAAAEAGNVPSVKKPHSVVVYGPLARFQTVRPDLAVFLVTPFQAMLISEAAEVVAWGAGANASVLGRPACAVLPGALESSSVGVSVACMGARTFAGISDDELILAIPAPSLGTIAAALDKKLAANAALKDYYQSQRAQFPVEEGAGRNGHG
jgi:uncharacterized protein (DUF169 family)